MEGFEFYTPTRIYFGRGVEENVGAVLKEQGAASVLVVYGGKSAEQSGLLPKLCGLLDKAGLRYVTLGGVRPNPRLSLAREGIRLGLEHSIDYILAVGGGSVIDTAKAISLGCANPEEDVWSFFAKTAVPAKRIPLASVLTIAAAGSETSMSAVITKDEGMLKRGLNIELNRPVLAFMNPALLGTLPKYQCACGVVDILMHTLERYFSPVEGNELTDQLAEGLLRTVFRYGARFVEHPEDYQAASEIMWAGSLSHNGLTGLGGASDFATHGLGHELSASFDAAHGATLAAIWPSWARYVLEGHQARFARYARAVWGCDAGLDDDAAAEQGIRLTEEYFRGIGMPVTVPELLGRALSEEEIQELALKCSFQRNRTVGSLETLDVPEMEAVYRLANQ